MRILLTNSTLTSQDLKIYGNVVTFSWEPAEVGNYIAKADTQSTMIKIGQVVNPGTFKLLMYVSKSTPSIQTSSLSTIVSVLNDGVVKLQTPDGAVYTGIYKGYEKAGTASKALYTFKFQAMKTRTEMVYTNAFIVGEIDDKTVVFNTTSLGSTDAKITVGIPSTFTGTSITVSSKDINDNVIDKITVSCSAGDEIVLDGIKRELTINGSPAASSASYFINFLSVKNGKNKFTTSVPASIAVNFSPVYP